MPTPKSQALAKAKHIDRVRKWGFIEGLSYLVLLFIAMPLKYFADLPLAVRIVGSIHGFLFVLLALVVLVAMTKKALSFGQSAAIGVASLIPFGTFLIDGWLKRLKPASIA